MVCFVPPAELAAELVAAVAARHHEGEGEEHDDEKAEPVPVEQMHVTLGYLGALDAEGNVSLGDEEGCSLETVSAAVAAYTATAAPLPAAMVSGVGLFNLEGGNTVVYASVDVPGLPEMRQGLVAALAAAGVPVAENHGFTAHVSLEYCDSPEPTLPSLPTELSWPVTAIEVWWGDEKHSFDLGG
jgi:2'-5' RNA ligase